MAQVVGNVYEYSEEWDALLNNLIDNSVEVEINPTGHTVNFKLKVGENVSGWFVKKSKPVFKIYEVWIANPATHYGQLHSVGGLKLPRVSYKSPKKETLVKLEAKVDLLAARTYYKLRG